MMDWHVVFGLCVIAAELGIIAALFVGIAKLGADLNVPIIITLPIASIEIVLGLAFVYQTCIWLN
jgi:hypothetical protein